MTGKLLGSEGETATYLPLFYYVRITGGYSVDTTPDVGCVEGIFNFKTIKPIKSSGQGYCGIESGEIEVNNARIEFSSGGKVKVSVDKEQKEYGCEEVGVLCKYEAITIAEGVGQKSCPVWYKDADKDGYTDGTTQVSCEKPSEEYVSSATAGDCNDNVPDINPARAEICNSLDNNCNGQTDEGNVCVFLTPKVSTGSYQTCAIKTDGSLWCWGYNSAGQLGTGDTTNRTIPTYIISLVSGGSAPYIGEGKDISFEERGKGEKEGAAKFGCSSANVVYYLIYLFFAVFVLFVFLFALRKKGLLGTDDRQNNEMKF